MTGENNNKITLRKLPAGAVRAENTVAFSAFSDKNVLVLAVLKDGGEAERIPMIKEENGRFFSEYRFERAGLYFVWLEDEAEERLCSAVQQTVYDEPADPPKGFSGGVMYQIFPDRFNIGGGVLKTPFSDRIIHESLSDTPRYRPDEAGEVKNNDYFGGNFKGIEDKLPYLKSLGVSCIYLNPIFEAHSNHRYNTADYMKPDPLLGTAEDFKRLCAEAKKSGIRIILDGVFSHTGSDSVYFNREKRYGEGGAYNDPESRYRAWYKFGENRDDYASWWGFKTLPETDENEESYIDFICGEGGVIDYWTGLGASGFRLDVADELPDAFIEKIRASLKRSVPDGLLIGEVWEDASDKISYSERRKYLLGSELDSVMNYPFRTAIRDFLKNPDGRLFRERVMTIVEHYPKFSLDNLMNFLSTHDTERAITGLAGESSEGKDRDWQAVRRLSRDEYLRGVELLKLAFTLLFTLPGIPCIYYGDELGMEGYRDPFNRGFMQWDNADENILSFVRELSGVREKCPAFDGGEIEFLDATDETVAFVRSGGGSRAAVVVNRGESSVTVELPWGESVTAEPWRGRIEIF